MNTLPKEIIEEIFSHIDSITKYILKYTSKQLCDAIEKYVDSDMCDEKGCELSDICYNAALKGHLDILRWVKDNGIAFTVDQL